MNRQQQQQTKQSTSFIIFGATTKETGHVRNKEQQHQTSKALVVSFLEKKTENKNTEKGTCKKQTATRNKAKN